MRMLEPFGGLARWIANTAFLLVIAVVVARALVEYFPVLNAVPLFGKIVRSWDPTFQSVFEQVGVRWTRDVRLLALPGIAIALVLLRVVVADALQRALRPAPAARPLPVAPAEAPPAPQRPPAPVASAPEDPAGTVITARPSAPAAPLVSPTGTGFFGAEQQKPRELPALIGRYQVLGELGRGAMGTVYKASDPRIGRLVAIKTISMVGAGPEMEQYRQRFLVEAKSAGRLTHPGVVAVYDVTEDAQGRPCLVLEFVDGATLDAIVAAEPPALPTILDYIAQIARALAYAHGHGIVHRDIKPANIMVTKDGTAKLSDFGIAKIEGTTLTVAGQVLGTPAFMSPEQCQGLAVDARSDIFSLGAVLYTLVAGTKPFPGQTFTSVAYQVVHTDQVPLTQIDPGLPAEIDAIVARCMAKDPQQRYGSAAELAEALEALRRSLPAAAAAPSAA